MKRLRGAHLGIAAWLFVLPISSLAAQATAWTPDALVDLEYLLGDWHVRSFERDDSGQMLESPVRSSYRARFMYDGLSVLAEFYGRSPRGFYGVHLISYDPDRGLVHHYLNARANRRLEFIGVYEDGEYHLTRRGGYGGGDFLFRETDSDIHPNSFVKRVFESHDEGETWQESGYCFVFERKAPVEPESPTVPAPACGAPADSHGARL